MDKVVKIAQAPDMAMLRWWNERFPMNGSGASVEIRSASETVP